VYKKAWFLIGFGTGIFRDRFYNTVFLMDFLFYPGANVFFLV